MGVRFLFGGFKIGSFRFCAKQGIHFFIELCRHLGLLGCLLQIAFGEPVTLEHLFQNVDIGR